MTTKTPSRKPTTRSPSVFDPTVGTAKAPTTPGGVCLNAEDYGLWTQNDAATGITGFDKFVNDITKCTLSCGYLVTSLGSTEYGCGGAFQPACPGDLLKRCINDCFLKLPPKNNVEGLLQVQNYTLPCTSCMSDIAECGATQCRSACVAGAKDSSSCQACNEMNCNGAFMACAGLNVNMPQTAELDLVPILAGTIGGFFALLIVVVVVGVLVYKRQKKDQVMSPEDLARMAGAQSMMMMAPGSSSQMKTPSYNNPGYSPNNQQQQQQQQRQQQGGGRMAPSVRMTSMANQAQQAPDMFKPTVPLVAIFDFVGERSDELSVTIGTRMFGIEQQDGWWLAKTEKGVVGLIPVSYTEAAGMDAPAASKSPKATGATYINPDF